MRLCPVGRPRHVSDRLWEEHRIPAALRQHLTRYFQNLHPAVFFDSWTVPFCPSSSIRLSCPPHLHGYTGYGCCQCRYHTDDWLRMMGHIAGGHARSRRVSWDERDALYDGVLLQT